MGPMATAAPSEREPKLDYESKSNGFDPDSFRMTVGEHLEELRGRLVKGLAGFFVAFAVCFYFSDYTINFFCAPLIKVLKAADVNPQLIAPDVTEGFMVAIRVSLITGAAIAGPWILFQLWQFVAAGLYPHERKYVTRYMPLSILLLAAGMVFVYLVVLPFTLSFFIKYIVDMPLHLTTESATQTTGSATAPAFPANTATILSFPGVPNGLPEGVIIYDTVDQRLKCKLGGVVRVIPFNSTNLLAPEIELGKYISLVVMMLVSVAIAFQLPLVVLLLERIGIVEVADLRASRRYVYFAIVVVSAVISPGDAITVTVALVGPLILLYEFGILLAVIGKPKADPA
jgi:Tat protein translocase TatC